MMTFQESIATCFRKYLSGKGRARRSEFWWFVLFYNLVTFVITFIRNLMVTPENTAFLNTPARMFIIMMSLAQLACIPPLLVAGIRRIQDAGHSGWWIFVPIVNLVFYLTDSQPGENKYGPNPKSGPGYGAHAGNQLYAGAPMQNYPTGGSSTTPAHQFAGPFPQQGNQFYLQQQFPQQQAVPPPTPSQWGHIPAQPGDTQQQPQPPTPPQAQPGANIYPQR